MVVMPIHLYGNADLFLVAGAADLFCLVSRFVQCRQQHSCQYGYDSDDDEELHQGKTQRITL